MVLENQLFKNISRSYKPSKGMVKYEGKVITKPVCDIAMVFQSFALMPWLTVLQNVRTGT